LIRPTLDKLGRQRMPTTHHPSKKGGGSMGEKGRGGEVAIEPTGEAQSGGRLFGEKKRDGPEKKRGGGVGIPKKGKKKGGAGR